MSFSSSRGNRSQTQKPTTGKNKFVPRLEALESRDLPSTFTVTSTGSDPNTQGTLPWAIQQSNAAPGGNTIDFNISGSGVQGIALTSIQYLTNPVVIDGTSQPGYNGTPLISVQGNSSVQVLFDFTTGSTGSTVEGLDMYNFTASAVSTGAGSNWDVVQNNWIGFFRDPTTGQVFLNSSLGYSGANTAVWALSSNDTIRNNVMSGLYNAVVIGEDPSLTWSGTVYKNNTVSANLFGTDPTGSTIQNYGNASDAVFLGAGAQGNLIGPTNVMAGGLHGVEFDAPTATGNAVFRNNIGTDGTGSRALPNNDGIDFGNGASGNAIGGPLGGNLISGSMDVGVDLGVPGYGAGNYNWVLNNVIGLNGSQTAVLGAGIAGVAINNGSVGNIVQGNVIAGASQNGVLLQGASSNTVAGNWLGESSAGTRFANGTFGISAINHSNNNYLAGNFFGQNNAGLIYLDSSSTGNNTGGVGTGQMSSPPSAPSLIGQIFQEYASAIQALQSGNVGMLFQDIQNIITLYFQLIASLTSI